MHYADGSPAKAGDLVMNSQTYTESQGQQTVGVLTSGIASSDSCNGNVMVVARRALSSLGWGPWVPITGLQNDWSVTLKQCLKIEWDFLMTLKGVQSS